MRISEPVGWDPTVPFEEYFRAAEALYLEDGRPDRFDNLIDELRGVPDQIEESCSLLGDRTHWAVPRPAIRILAHITHLGNLTVRWLPAMGYLGDKRNGPDQFDVAFLERHVSVLATFTPWGGRPRDEVLFIRDFRPYPYGPDPLDRYIAYAGWSAYETLIRRLSEAVQVIEPSPLASILRLPKGMTVRQLGPGTRYLLDWARKERSAQAKEQIRSAKHARRRASPKSNSPHNAASTRSKVTAQKGHGSVDYGQLTADALNKAFGGDAKKKT